MDNLAYDISKLRSFDGFDLVSALENFSDLQKYFHELDKFIEESSLYLKAFTPFVVIYSDDVRKDFLKDAGALKEYLSSLGMVSAAASLHDLEEAAEDRAEKALSDGILVFYTKIKIMRKNLISARQLEDEPSYVPIILAVTHSPELTRAIADALDNRYTLLTATGIDDALKIIESRTPWLFLLDAELPHMAGFSLAGRIRQFDRFTETPILFLTGNNTVDFMSKPLDGRLLLGKIEQYLK